MQILVYGILSLPTHPVHLKDPADQIGIFKTVKFQILFLEKIVFKMTPQNPFEDIKRMHQLSLFGTTTLLL